MLLYTPMGEYRLIQALHQQQEYGSDISQQIGHNYKQTMVQTKKNGEPTVHTDWIPRAADTLASQLLTDSMNRPIQNIHTKQFNLDQNVNQEESLSHMQSRSNLMVKRASPFSNSQETPPTKKYAPDGEAQVPSLQGG